jgi:hypothetical protein
MRRLAVELAYNIMIIATITGQYQANARRIRNR